MPRLFDHKSQNLTAGQFYKEFQVRTGFTPKIRKKFFKVLTACLMVHLTGDMPFNLPKLAKFEIKKKKAQPQRYVHMPFRGAFYKVEAKPAKRVLVCRTAARLRKEIGQGEPVFPIPYEVRANN